MALERVLVPMSYLASRMVCQPEFACITDWMPLVNDWDATCKAAVDALPCSLLCFRLCCCVLMCHNFTDVHPSFVWLPLCSLVGATDVP